MGEKKATLNAHIITSMIVDFSLQNKTHSQKKKMLHEFMQRMQNWSLQAVAVCL